MTTDPEKLAASLTETVEVTPDPKKLDEVRHELRAAYMEVQRIKRSGLAEGEGVLPPIWRAINAIPAALYHLDKMPEFEADLAAEQAHPNEGPNHSLAGLDDRLLMKLRGALRFAASHNCLTSVEEQAILARFRGTQETK